MAHPWRIHVTGAPRSGTTLMLALMLSCFDIDGAETKETRLWRAATRGKRAVLTKQPADEALALFLMARDPKLHVIWMLRDPRDVVVSIHGSAPDQYWTNVRAWRESVAVARPYLGHPRFHLVRYDDLARDPDAVQAKLAAAMPFLAETRPFSRFHDFAELEHNQWRVAMRSIRSISPDSVGVWRKHLPRLKGQLERHGDISGELIELGFETDRAWLSLLDGVDADTRPSRTPEAGSLRRRFNHRWRDFLGMISYGMQRVL
ncbi:MAG TPA: sulfotransferase [Rhizomicrobium sp.]|nr:sulfotransferase [Rhizomicrobium sp.]